MLCDPLFTIVLNVAYIVSVMIVKCCTLGNPLHEKHDAEGDWRQQVEGKLPRLKKLDGTNATHHMQFCITMLDNNSMCICA